MDFKNYDLGFLFYRFISENFSIYIRVSLKTITPVEKAYLDTIKSAQKKISKKSKNNE
ncbi:MAG: hypothetical protein LBO62_03580 [Endomicrobium sp.]|nr:hypothetical protein [Endomicrobium sp.]